MKQTQTFGIITLLAFSLFAIPSCKNDPITTDIDWELYEMAQKTAGFTWYKNSSAVWSKSVGSGHSNPKLRTRYNSIASQFLDSTGKVIENSNFSDGSLIVKELMDTDENLNRYAILYKDSGNESADANGWVWGYINADGTVAESATKKGVSCTGCHSQAGNIDSGLMNKEFP
ncbi:MAG: hypothetical protein ACI85Q_001940 [Salibacteraceae bacterium]|jgi:hypothetical protein